jgi:hypothetical protein
MMIRIEFDTDNAAFDGPELFSAVSAILAELAASAADGLSPVRIIRDPNGKRIGQMEYIETDLDIVEG